MSVQLVEGGEAYGLYVSCTWQNLCTAVFYVLPKFLVQNILVLHDILNLGIKSTLHTSGFSQCQWTNSTCMNKNIHVFNIHSSLYSQQMSPSSDLSAQSGYLSQTWRCLIQCSVFSHLNSSGPQGLEWDLPQKLGISSVPFPQWSTPSHTREYGIQRWFSQVKYPGKHWCCISVE